MFAPMLFCFKFVADTRVYIGGATWHLNRCAYNYSNSCLQIPLHVIKGMETVIKRSYWKGWALFGDCLCSICWPFYYSLAFGSCVQRLGGDSIKLFPRHLCICHCLSGVTRMCLSNILASSKHNTVFCLSV